MRFHLRSWAVWVAAGFLMAAFAVPASAGDLYTNGPVNGTIDAFTINHGFQVANTFTLSSGSTLTDVNFGAWNSPGDTTTSVGWEILNVACSPATSCNPFTTSTVLYSGTSSVTSTFDFVNPFGDNVNTDSFNLPSGVTLGAGMYYLLLDNATTPSGDLVVWDQNNGPSIAWESALGLLSGTDCGGAGMGGTGTCSEAFTINGTTATTTPEPSSILLFGTSLLGLAPFGRKLFGR